MKRKVAGGRSRGAGDESSKGQGRQLRDAKEKPMGQIPRLRSGFRLRALAALTPASRLKIQRTLVETMLAVLEGRMATEEALAIAMVAEEQIRMLDEAESKRRSVEGAKGPVNKRRWVN